MRNCERRFAPSDMEVRDSGNGGKVLTAYAVVWNRYSKNLGGFVEEVAPGAATKTIQEQDIRALLNHDKSLLLGRNMANTLRLSEDTTGLHYEVDLPNTQTGRDLAESIDRGDISGSSFSFTPVGPEGDRWSLTDQEMPLRTVQEMRLYDVGPVTYPAYPSTEEEQTKLALRSLERALGVEQLPADRDSIVALLNGDADSADFESERNREKPAQPTSRDLLIARMRTDLATLDV